VNFGPITVFMLIFSQQKPSDQGLLTRSHTTSGDSGRQRPRLATQWRWCWF